MPTPTKPNSRLGKFSTGAPNSQNEPFAVAKHDRIEARVT